MSIPRKINLPRFWAACFNLPFPNNFDPETVEHIVVELGRVLGFEEVVTRAFWKEFQETVAEQGEKFAADPRNLLLVDKWFANLQSFLESKLREITSERWNEIGERLDRWLRPRMLLTPEQLGRLSSFIGTEWMLRNTPGQIARPILTAKITALELYIKFPEETKQAVKTWLPGTIKDDALHTSHLQNQGRIAFLGSSGATPPVGAHPADVRIAVQNRLDMWCGVFETSMWDACKLLWYVMQLERGRTDWQDFVTNKKGEPAKGDMYNRILEWCKKHDVTFPFFERLVLMRNKDAHWQVVMDDDNRKVRVLDLKGNVLDTFDFADIETKPYEDYETATHFGTGVLSAFLEYQNHEGELDEAWAALIGQLQEPELLLDPEDEDEDETARR